MFFPEKGCQLFMSLSAIFSVMSGFSRKNGDSVHWLSCKGAVSGFTEGAGFFGRAVTLTVCGFRPSAVALSLISPASPGFG